MFGEMNCCDMMFWLSLWRLKLMVCLDMEKSDEINPDAGAPSGGPPGRLMMLTLVVFRKVYKL